jgi:hypothetical protein
MAMDARPHGFKIVVRKPTGGEESLFAQCDKVVVGSGAHCEVRLPIEAAAVEHVELTISSGRVYARARAFEPPTTIGGSPFVQGFVDPGVEIGIGALRILASVAEGGGPATTAGTAKKKSGTMRLAIMGAFGLLLLLLLQQQTESAPSATASSAPAPPLWGPPPAACPQNAPPQALALAEEKMRIAEGKRERRPFHVQDGVAAVPLFELASVCFATAGDEAMASTARQAAADLRARVNEDYHAHQVRLEHALNVKDAPTVLHEATALRALTEGLAGPYVSWLAVVERASRPQPKAARKVL